MSSNMGIELESVEILNAYKEMQRPGDLRYTVYDKNDKILYEYAFINGVVEITIYNYFS